MAKQNWRPGNMLYPLPAVMVSVGDSPDSYNIITVAWTGTVCSDPPMCYISVRPERFSHSIIERTGEFVINLTTERLARATDWCGVRSGRDYRKFDEMGLTPVPASVVGAPLIAESPLSIECRVEQTLRFGSHDMYVARVVNVAADEAFIDPRTGSFDLAASGLMAYVHGGYFALGRKLGKFGFSVEKKRRGRR